MQLVEDLSTPLEGKKYIENNNEVKLILIYQNNKTSEAGLKAFDNIMRKMYKIKK